MIYNKILVAALVSLFSSLVLGNAQKSPYLEDQVTEVLVLSIQFDSGRRASLVVRPCDLNEACKNMLLRTDRYTRFQNEGEDISFEAARSLNWEYAAVSMDKFNVATEIRRIEVQGAG